ncbi:hypothetical protein [Nocardia salmonicida]|uniref:hypothetical protein n=1 Tax=Nocardia salmonicida TaxID=53431 RepID=UPI002E29BFEC|nr:hypothetical protein [Nocardia salmonicida]
MSSIKDHYKIHGQVPFIDVELTVDNQMYVDPHRIRLMDTPQPFADDACRAMDIFTTEIASCVLSSNATDHRRGRDLLQHFNEPRETRLGMSAAGINGHGGAKVLGAAIWDSLAGPDLRPLLEIGILRKLEAVPVYVEGIGNDITSDLTTRIIFAALAAFTAEMVATYPEFRRHPEGMTTVQRPVWDGVNRRWRDEYFELPVAEGRPLVLVPEGWAGHTLLMSHSRFFDVEVLGWAQIEQAIIREGKVLKTPKTDLRRQPGLSRGRTTSIAVTMRAFHDSQVNLFDRFGDFVDGKWEPPHGLAAA